MWVRKPPGAGGWVRRDQKVTQATGWKEPECEGAAGQQGRHRRESLGRFRSQRAGGAQSRRQKGSQAGDRRGLRQETGGRGSEATQTTIVRNHAVAKLESSQHAAGGSRAPWRFRRGWAGAMSPRSWREQDPGDSRSQRRAESGGGGSREAAGSERREKPPPSRSLT